MSPYGAVAVPTPKEKLTIKTWPLPSRAGDTELVLVTYPITGSDAPKEVLEYLCKIFDAEVEGGRTYPQSDRLDLDGFIAYFFSSTTIVGVVQPADAEVKPTIAEALVGRSVEEALGGCYYVKPNYPGRSSHNGGFIVPTTQRGRKIGLNLGKTFLHYAPALGYRGSVFNLVYENNVPSLAIWDSLGFQRIGKIPQVGCLKTGPNGSEEYVDAYVIYKSFV
ncbi:hypothetical protein IAT40_006080 [Kwoniella sp. CBS 6097]